MVQILSESIYSFSSHRVYRKLRFLFLNLFYSYLVFLIVFHEHLDPLLKFTRLIYFILSDFVNQWTVYKKMGISPACKYKFITISLAQNSDSIHMKSFQQPGRLKSSLSSVVLIILKWDTRIYYFCLS